MLWMVSGAMTWPRRGSARTRRSARRRASAARIAAFENPKRATSCASDTGAPGSSSRRTIAWRSRSWAAAPDPATEAPAMARVYLTCQMEDADMSAMNGPTTAPAAASHTVDSDGREHLIRYGGEFSDLLVERADGSWLTTEDGRRILDFTSGQMCATLGHGHPAILEAMSEASGRVVHLFSGFLSRDVTELARELMAVLPEPLTRAMFLSTGGEANEAALRLAKLHTGGHEVLAFTGSWHGMTAGASSSTYSAGHRGYGPAVPGTMALPTPNAYRCPIAHCTDRCDLACLDVGFALADAQSVGSPAAVIVEPILS